MESGFVTFQGSRLHYVSSGKGTHALLFFHGFGQDHSVYLPLIRALSKDYRLFVFDLYFHGQSTWAHGERPLEKKHWIETLSLFLQEQKVADFSVVGFSLGGKFALAAVEAWPDRVKKLFLIAPDGIKTSFWYSMATYPVLLRRFFRSMVDRYDRFEKLTSFLHRMKLVDSGLVRFADYQMGTHEKRQRVYYSWVVFRHLTFNVRKIARLINTHGVATTVIAGRHDKVIVPDNLRGFVKRIPTCRFHILESGHSGLIYESLSFIRK